jgi:hypothetical protein
MTTFWLCRAPGAATEGPFSLEQLRRMYEAGAVTADALVCREGQEDWFSLQGELEETVPRAYRFSRRVKTGGSGCAALVFGLIGLFFCVMWFPFGLLPGLLLIVIGALMDAKYGTENYCSGCGNQVAGTSKQCPNCRAVLELVPFSSKLKGWLKQGVVILVILAVLTVIVTWVVVKLQPQ